MYILQESLISSFEELQKIESKERLPIFFGTLDLRPYAKELRNPHPEGRMDIAVKAFFARCMP